MTGAPGGNAALRTVLVVLVLAAALAAGVALHWVQHDAAADRATGAALFAASLPDASGAPQALAQYKGRVLVVNFWATWCAPCVGEMPDLQKIQDEYSARGVSTVGIAIDRADAVREFQQRGTVHYPLLVADTVGSELVRRLGDDEGALPYTAVLGAGGAVVVRHLGAIEPAQLRRWLDQELKRRG